MDFDLNIALVEEENITNSENDEWVAPTELINWGRGSDCTESDSTGGEGDSTEDEVEDDGEENELATVDDVLDEEALMLESDHSRAEERTTMTGDGGHEGCGDQDNEKLSKGAPVNGMEFESFALLLEFYQEYARRLGFSVILRTSKANYVTLICDKGGKSKQGSRSKRSGCTARVNAKRMADGRCSVGFVVLAHTHNLDDSICRKMPAHRKVSTRVQRNLLANDIAGIPVSKNVRLQQVQAGGPENLGCTPDDCRNYIYKKRKILLEDGDAEALNRFFKDMQSMDSEFYYVIDMTPSGRLKNVLWVHPQCKVAFQEFHDVVCFDTTYLVNAYKMPFGSFVGVNHHGQSILLGCALISREDIATYTWLFRMWIDAMGGVHPICMLTDECNAIRGAIQKVMPEVRHRLCIWHIYHKLPTKLSGVRSRNDIREELFEIVSESFSTSEFKSRWKSLIESHGLENHEWFVKLYKLRKLWVPVYINNIFWAGMRSTQRSESMHAFFDTYINRNSTLSVFASKYELALRSRHEKEMDEQYASRYKHQACHFGFKWESQLESVLTRNIFRIVQEELLKMVHQEVLNVVMDTPGVEIFIIQDRTLANRRRLMGVNFTVQYLPNGEYVECSCKMQLSWGVLCCHMMRVMAYKQIDALHERYILRRWRKDIERPHLKRFMKGGYPKMSDDYQLYTEILHHFDRAVEEALPSQRKREYLIEELEKIHDKLKLMSEPRDGDTARGGGPTLQNPEIVRSKGRPRGKRYKSAIERKSWGKKRR